MKLGVAKDTAWHITLHIQVVDIAHVCQRMDGYEYGNKHKRD